MKESLALRGVDKNKGSFLSDIDVELSQLGIEYLYQFSPTGFFFIGKSDRLALNEFISG
jgi:hypothetical protein